MLILISLPTILFILYLVEINESASILYPDISDPCWPGYNSETLEEINKECVDPKLILEKYKLNIPCLRGCTLARLYSKHGKDSENSGVWETPHSESWSKHFIQMFRNPRIAYYFSFELEKCYDLAHEAFQKGKNCLEWKEAHECVEEAVKKCPPIVAGLKGVYPDLRCWQDYTNGRLEEINEECKNPLMIKEKTNMRVPCEKACILVMMNSVTITTDAFGANIFPSGKGENLRATLNKIFNGNPEPVEGLHAGLIKCSENAFAKLKAQVPCEEWNDVYDCVESVAKNYPVNSKATCPVNSENEEAEEKLNHTAHFRK